MSDIPEEVRALAEEPMASARELPPGAETELIRTDRFCVVVGPVLSVNMVQGATGRRRRGGRRRARPATTPRPGPVTGGLVRRPVGNSARPGTATAPARAR